MKNGPKCIFPSFRKFSSASGSPPRPTPIQFPPPLPRNEILAEPLISGKPFLSKNLIQKTRGISLDIEIIIPKDVRIWKCNIGNVLNLTVKTEVPEYKPNNNISGKSFLSCRWFYDSRKVRAGRNRRERLEAHYQTINDSNQKWKFGQIIYMGNRFNAVCERERERIIKLKW